MSISKDFPSKTSLWYSFGVILSEMYHINNLWWDECTLNLPLNLPELVKDLLTRLLMTNAESIITDSFIMNHPFFANINWTSFKRQHMTVPYLLQRGCLNIVNFNLLDISIKNQIEYGFKRQYKFCFL